jgi:DNA topoisomerase-1
MEVLRRAIGKPTAKYALQSNREACAFVNSSDFPICRPANAEGFRAAKSAGLKYVSDKSPGFRRLGTRKVFRYLDTEGRLIKDVHMLNRIQQLAIPPAWTAVWICPTADGHIQAVGRDARGRKQYRYHSDWRESRDETKFHRISAFGKALKKIRRRVARDIRGRELTREKVLATVVRILDKAFIRVGNREYMKDNKSFGLTTLRDRHVRIRGSKVRFYFRGKSGVKQVIDIENAALAKIVRRLRDLPGYELFQYYDAGGALHVIESGDVNRYLRETAGEDFTAKDFRTWAGTMVAARSLSGPPSTTVKEARKKIKTAISNVADRLGNTAAVCRKSYIHPAIMEAYMEGSLHLKDSRETSVLAFLKRHSKSRPMSLEKSLARSVQQVRRK